MRKHADKRRARFADEAQHLSDQTLQIPTRLGRVARKNHRTHEGLWLRLAKKDSDSAPFFIRKPSTSALCHGWIDGQKKPENEQTWLQKFAPRGPRSIWSKINREKAQALIANGKMKQAGLDAIENAKKNGRWESAYDSPSGASVPADLQAALDASPRAAAFFKTLNKANSYADPMANPNREKSRNPRPQNRTIHRHAGAKRKTHP